jgi:hypothetical protein
VSPVLQLKEHVLPDDYPVYEGYYYVADGRVRTSDIEGTVANLKALWKATEVRRCDAVARGLEIYF